MAGRAINCSDRGNHHDRGGNRRVGGAGGDDDFRRGAGLEIAVGRQLSGRRYALLFEPGTYGSDDNFWRSLSNLTLNVHLPKTAPAYAPKPGDPDGAGCDNSAEFWAVSQAVPLRRVIINGSVAFQDYCARGDFASGGFIADSQVTGKLGFYGNQQYLVRNSKIGGTTACPNGLWNMVYSGVKGAPAQVFTGQCQQNTVLSTSPVTEEEPFLYAGTGGYRVFVPAVKTRSSGTSWAGGSEAGKSLPLSSFFVASPATPVRAINSELARP